MKMMMTTTIKVKIGTTISITRGENEAPKNDKMIKNIPINKHGKQHFCI